METLPKVSRPKPVVLLSVALAIALALLAALGGWMVHGTSILYTYAQNGLSWCF